MGPFRLSRIWTGVNEELHVTRTLAILLPESPLCAAYIHVPHIIYREINILHALSHELVLPLMDCWHEQDYICMVFEQFHQVLVNISCVSLTKHEVT